MPQKPLSTISPTPDLAAIPEPIWEEARRREALIRPLAEQPISPKDQVEAAAQALGMTSRRVYTLIQRYRRSGGLLTSLIPGKTSGGRGKSRLPEAVDTLIQEAIEAVYLTRQQAPASRVVEDVRRRCHRAGLQAPSGNAIRQRIRSLPVRETVKRRQGAKAARAYQMPVTGAFPESAYPLAVVQMDHTPVDLIVVDEVERQPIGRPYLTLAIDTYSRCITGVCLSLDPPSAVSVGLCLTHAVLDKTEWLAARGIEGDWPIWGKPERIHVDNGAEFHSEALHRGCAQHGIELDYRPAGRPHYGGIVERVIGTLMQLVHDLPGTTFSNIAERGDYDSSRQAALTLGELEQWLTVAIIDYYHHKPHAGLGAAPLARYQEGRRRQAEVLGESYPRRLSHSRAFIIDFLPVVWRTLQRHGFMIDKIAYYSDTLRPLIGDKDQGKFLIRRDPRDLSRVYVLDPKSQHYLEVPYRNLSRPSITLWEHRLALKRMREQGQARTDEAALFRAIEEMRAITQTAAAKTRSVRRQLERQRLAAPGPAATPVASDAADTPKRRNSLVERFKDIETW